MTYENSACGRSNSAQTIIAVRLKRIAESQPTAWEGETVDGDKIHIAYRFGEVSVDVRYPANGQVETWNWRTVARFHPARHGMNLQSRFSEKLLKLPLHREPVSFERRDVRVIFFQNLFVKHKAGIILALIDA